MKKHTTARTQPAMLDEHTLRAAAGGNYEDDWCGTRVPGRPIPLPRPEIVIFDPGRIDIVIGSRIGLG